VWGWFGAVRRNWKKFHDPYIKPILVAATSAITTASTTILTTITTAPQQPFMHFMTWMLIDNRKMKRDNFVVINELI
jgi:hypothetical protein